MGLGISKASATSVAKSLTSVVNSSIQSTAAVCAANLITNQEIDIGSISGGSNITITNNTAAIATLTCLQSQSSSAAAANNIKTDLNSTLTGKAVDGVTFGIGVSDSQTSSYQEQVTNISNLYSQTQTQSAISNLQSNQKITAQSISDVTGLTISNINTQSVVQYVVQSQTQMTSAINNLAAQIASDGTATASTGLDITGLIYLLAAGVAAIIIILILLKVFKVI